MFPDSQMEERTMHQESEEGHERTTRSFGFGPAPIPFERGKHAWYLIRLAVSGATMLLHLALAIMWSWSGSWWLVGLAAFHLVVGVPVSHKRLTRPELIYSTDVAAISVGLLILGDPGAVIPWSMVTTVFVIGFIGGRAAVVSLLGSNAIYGGIAFIVANYEIVAAPPSYRPIVYQTAAAIVAIGFTVALALASGAAIRAREADLTRERKALRRSQREIARANTRLEAITQGTPIGLALQDSAGRFLTVNDGLVQITGMSQEDIRRRGVAPLMVPEERATIERAVVPALETGGSYHLQHRLWRRDGKQRFVEVWGTPIDDPEGDGDHNWVVTMIDRTVEVEQNQRIEQLATIVEATTDLVGGFDAVGRLIGGNAAFQEFYGLQGEWRGRVLADVAAADAAADTDLFFELAGASPARSIETELTRHDGVRVPVSLVALRQRGADASLDTYAWICRDISAQRENEQSLQDAIESRDRLVANVSHELRTPLTAVVGLAHELRDRYPVFDDGEVSEFIEIMVEQSSEVSSIVEDLLAMARADAGQLTVRRERIGLIESVMATLDSLPTELANRIDVSNGEVKVLADPQRTRQIIRNLLTNAQRYGGDRIEVSMRVIDGMACLEVADDGQPINADQQARMFEAYERLSPEETIPGSTGLGLTVSRELAQLMGGRLELLREDDMNVFCLLLPLAT